MKIKLNKEDTLKLTKLIDMKYLNIEASDFYNSYLDNDYLSVTREAVKELVKTQSMSEDDAFFTSILLAKDIAPEDSEVLNLKENCYINKVSHLNPKSFAENSFNTDLTILDRKSGSWELKHNFYDPYEGFLFDDVFADPNNYFAERNNLGYFTQKVNYLTVMQNDVVWMSITPYEINTMKKAISNAHGKVITYGLGLGYFAFSVLNKPEVSSVTVIESNDKAIRLFESEILPKIRLKSKIRIIKADAFDYSKNHLKEENYDFSFFDIYHTASDGLPSYVKMKQLEKTNPSTEYEYWIENSILSYLRRFVITLIEENLNGFTDADYQEASTDDDRLINAIYNSLKDSQFNTFDEIHSLLTNESLKKLASEINY
ncbi:MAG: hypothetical protein WCR67_01310 [Bacilli bacterium]